MPDMKAETRLVIAWRREAVAKRDLAGVWGSAYLTLDQIRIIDSAVSHRRVPPAD